MENTDSERSRVCPTWKPVEAGISRVPAYSVHFLKICHGVGRRVDSWNYRTDVHRVWCKINDAYYRDVLLGQYLLPVIRSVTGDFFTYNAPAQRAGDTVEVLSRNTPDFISPLLWPRNSPDLNPVDYEVWGVLQQRVYRSRIRDVDHLKQSLIEEWRCFDQNITDRAVRLCACVRANGGHFEHKL